MPSHRFLRLAAAALSAYGILGLLVALGLLLAGGSALNQLLAVDRSLETQRVALVQSIRTAGTTLQDTVGATAGAQQSVQSASGAADQASKLANDSAGTFRELGASLASLTLLGFQPLVGLGPRFGSTADQLQLLAISLGTTRDALAHNASDVQQVGADLSRLQAQLDAMATALSQTSTFGLDARGVFVLQAALYGLCLLVVVQSALAIVAAVMLFRLAGVGAATTSVAAEHDRAPAL